MEGAGTLVQSPTLNQCVRLPHDAEVAKVGTQGQHIGRKGGEEMGD